MSENDDFQAELVEVMKQVVANQSRQAHTEETALVSSVVGDEGREYPLSGTELAAGGPNGRVLVPALTPEETSTRVSSAGKKMVAIDVPENIDAREFRRAVAAAYLEYIISGSVTLDGIVERSNLAPTRAGLILASPEFRTACAVRGIVTSTNPGISPRQDYALQIILDTSDGLSLGRKLKKAGVSNSEFRAWLQNPLFSQHYQRVTDQLLMDNRPAIIALANKAGEGDLAAIKFQMEVNGFHNPNKQSQVDVAVMMNRVMEVLFKHVDNRDTLLAISAEMSALGEAAGLSQQRVIEA